MAIHPVASTSTDQTFLRATPKQSLSIFPSTITTMVECGKKPSIYWKIYQKSAKSIERLKRYIARFWRWCLSWIPSHKQSKQWIYYKIENGEEEVSKYRLLDGGVRTNNVIAMGENTVYLSEIAFDDQEALSKLPKMLDQIMDGEKIDVIQTKQLKIAKQLWRSGLKTDGNLELKIPFASSLDPLLHKLICQVIKEREKLEKIALDALERIEEYFVMAVVAESFTQSDDITKFFHQAIVTLERQFSGIDLKEAAKRLEQKEEIDTVKASVRDFSKEIDFAVSHGMNQTMTLDVPLNAFFEIEDAIDFEFKSSLSILTHHLITFKKEKK